MTSSRTAALAITSLALISACRSTQSNNDAVESNRAVQPVGNASASSTGALPVVGKPAPNFTLTSNENKPTTLGDMRGKWVVLYFYPKNFTGGCTLEAQNFQRDVARYESLNAVILGVSVDSVESHREFCTKEGLSFRLLSDTDGAVSRRYGSLKERGAMRTSLRNTFVIDPAGNIAAVFSGVSPVSHSTDVLATLEGLRGR